MAEGDALAFELDDEDLKVFTEEANDQLEILDATLIQLEAQVSPELVQQIFRAAHTLKGSSATIGHRRMASLTHAMETVLDAVRQGQRHPTSAMVDALLEGLDSIASLHAGLTAHGYSAPVATLLIGAANVMSFAIRDDDFQKQIKRVEE